MRFSLLLLALFSSGLCAAEKKVGPKKPTCVLIENGPSSHTATLIKQKSKYKNAWKPIYGKTKKKTKVHLLRLKTVEMGALRATLTGNDVLLTVVDDDCATYDDIIHTEDGPLESTISRNVKLFTITSHRIPHTGENQFGQRAQIEAAIQNIIGDRRAQRIEVSGGLKILLVENLPTQKAKLIGALLHDKKEKTRTKKKTVHHTSYEKPQDSNPKNDLIFWSTQRLLSSIGLTKGKQ